MSQKAITLKNIGWPAEYVRTEPDEQHVADLRDVVKNGSKGYPFEDAVLVRLLDKPVKYAMTMAGKAGTCEYELVKGLHRCLSLQLERGRYAMVMAEVKQYTKADLEGGTALFDQYDNHGVLKLSVLDRAAFIKRLRAAPFKWSVEQVAAKMHISTASVSRIARNLQAVAERKGGGRKKVEASAPAAEGQAQAAPVFLASEWFKLLQELLDAGQDNFADLVREVKTVDPAVLDTAITVCSNLRDERSR